MAGHRSLNGIDSCLIQGSDDGKVSIERTKVAGMTGHITIPATHTFIMRHRTALRQTFHILRTGAFAPRQSARSTGSISGARSR
ncbi:MAG: hypothetical protein ABIV50_10140 [Opitutus sp.]